MNLSPHPNATSFTPNRSALITSSRRQFLVILVILLLFTPLIAITIDLAIKIRQQPNLLAQWLDAATWLLIARSLLFSATAAAIAVAVAWIAITAIICQKRPWHIPLALLTILPILIPSSLTATAWIAAFGKEGLLAQWLPQLTKSEFWNIYSTPSAAIATALRYHGLAVLYFLLHHRCSAHTNPARRIFKIPLYQSILFLDIAPRLLPTLAAWLIVCIFVLNDHILPEMLLVNTFGTQVLIRYTVLMDFSGAAVLSLPIALFGCACFYLLFLTRRTLPFQSAIHPTSPIHHSFLSRILALFILLVILLFSLVLPVIALGYPDVTFSTITKALTEASSEIRNTALAASIAAVGCCIFGSFLSNHWLQNRLHPQLALPPLIILNLCIPANLIAIGLIKLQTVTPGQVAVDDFWFLVLAYIIRFTPVAMLMLYFINQNNTSTENLASSLFHISFPKRLIHITIPRHAAHWLVTAIVCGLLIAGELSMSVLLTPAGQSTLGVRLYSLIHTAPRTLVHSLAIAIVLLLIPFIILWFALLLSNPSAKR